MFLEIEGTDRDNVCHLELINPFLNLDPGNIPALALCSDYGKALELRGLGMQLERAFNADTLYSAIPIKEYITFDIQSRKSYILDDYTRFPVMEELFVEFIPEIRTRQAEGRREIQVLATDSRGDYRFTRGAALVLLDGVPVLDHEKILSYDPLLVKRIDIYPDSYFVGIRGFSGIVNCVGKEYPDYRQTLYWHPLLTLGPGESMEIDCKMPVYPGRFEAVAEGLTASGGPVSASSTF